MDSLTQATLGAAVGHICWQDKIGKKGLIAGAMLGTLPDLDILLYPFLDEVQRLYWHRGESHSIWFILLGSLFFCWLLPRLKATKNLSVNQIAIGAFLIFATHILIDLFTVYGTQLLAPVSRKGFALNNIFIIDPLFTAPLFLGICLAYFGKNPQVGLRMNQLGLLLASIYALWSIGAQHIADQKFRDALTEQNIQADRHLTSASAFNTILWRHVAETSDGYLMGYWSFLDDKDQLIHFQFIPKNADIIDSISSTRTFQVVEWFSKGWWFVAESDTRSARVVDLRFTEIPGSADQGYVRWQWPFAWKFHLDEAEETRLKAVVPRVEDPLTTLNLLAQRIRGQRGWLSQDEKTLLGKSSAEPQTFNP